MAVELRFRKLDATPWGFRLTGGADYDTPLTVVKVTEDSIAENAGMQVGDFIVRVNDISITGLTHVQAHDIILKAGNEFVLGVKRGDSLNLPPPLPSETPSEDQDASDPKPTRIAAGKDDQDLNITDEEIAGIIGEPLQILRTEKIIKQSEVLQAMTAEDEAIKVKERKWSTFLQKPKNPIPKLRRPVEEKPKATPYRVVIKKQSKKCLEEPTPVVNGDAKPELEPENEEQKKRCLEEPTPVVNGDAKPEQEPEDEEHEDEDLLQDEKGSCGEDAVESSDEVRKQNEIDVESPEQDQSLPQSETEDMEQDSYAESSMKECDIKRMSASLEEQLVQVQKQLLALSKLPSAIQSTLNAVTQQLELIVSITQHEVVQEEVVEEDILEELYTQKALSTLDEEEVSEVGESVTEEEVKEDNEEVKSSSSTEDKEIEAQREEQEKVEKMEKVNHWNHIWPWSDVTKPVYRINFLKYKTPPKNLDHLQRSDVYRMIHDMEPPIRGIKARETKILAEQDYYGKKEESDSSLSPQMER